MPLGQMDPPGQPASKRGDNPVQGRQDRRAHVRMFGTVSHVGISARVLVTNLSREGMGLDLYEPFKVPLGTLVTVSTPDLGYLQGRVVWAESRRIGLSLELNTNAVAQISSYFRFMHEAKNKR